MVHPNFLFPLVPYTDQNRNSLLGLYWSWNHWMPVSSEVQLCFYYFNQNAKMHIYKTT